MSTIIRFHIYSNYLTLGTYSVPNLRVRIGELLFPYALIFCIRLGICVVSRSFAVVVLSIVVPTYFSFQPEWPDALEYGMFLPMVLILVISASNISIIENRLLLLALSGFGVFLHGAYGYFTGTIGDPNKHPFGYFSITYTTSIRNCDLLYA